MAFARVDDQQTGRARRCKHRLQGFDRGLEQADVVAERLAEAARLEEVALHVDDEEGRAVELDGKRLRFSGDQGFHGLPFRPAPRRRNVVARRPDA